MHMGAAQVQVGHLSVCGTSVGMIKQETPTHTSAEQRCLLCRALQVSVAMLTFLMKIELPLCMPGQKPLLTSSAQSVIVVPACMSIKQCDRVCA